jgi:L-ascorbate metabolism protein UlaG (beta-lactamase superfamily)
MADCDIVKDGGIVYLGAMEISYLGHACFKLRGKSITVVTDPFAEKAGKFPKDVKADIITVSHDHFDHNATGLVQEPDGGRKPFVITDPGEYEIGGVSVVGVPTWHDDKKGQERGRNTVYVIEMEGVRLAHCGDLGHKLAQDELDEMGPIDVLFVPVGGLFTLDAKAAAEVVKQVDPWVVIPMHYQQPELDQKTFGQLTGVEKFLTELGKGEMETVTKYVISAERMPEELQVVVMARR